MNRDEPDWPLPPDETAGYYQRSIEAAVRNPHLKADFIWEPSPEFLVLDRLCSGELEPPRGVLEAPGALMFGALLADIALMIAAILGSMPWHTVENLCALIFFPALALSMLIVTVTVVVLAGRLPRTIAGFFARSLTGLAAFAAGRQGPALFAEWNAHLAGDGHAPASWSKVRLAAGFGIAGARCRCSDWSDAAWRPADVVLRSRFLSGLFVAIPTIVAAAEVLSHKGTMTVLTSFGSIFGIGTSLAGAIKAGRKYRDVEPRQASKDNWGA